MWKVEIKYTGAPTGPESLESDERPVISCGEGMMRFQTNLAELWLAIPDVRKISAYQSGDDPKAGGWA
jgi:hypothetical protein